MIVRWRELAELEKTNFT